MMSFIYIAAVFTVVVGIHELGHFLAARLFGMRVHKFAIGFGPQLIFTPVKGGTEYALGLLPLGGYVAIAGMSKEEQNVPDGFYSKSRFAQIVVMSAGVLANFLLACVMFTAAQLVAPPEIRGEELSFLDALAGGITATVVLVQAVLIGTFEFLGGLFTFSVNPVEEVVGPVGIASMAAEAGNAGLFTLFGFIALLSVVVGVTNILPIPPLDGGKILFILIEAVQNRALSNKTTIVVSLVGVGFLLTLFILGTVGDVGRLLN